ncbi:hypothetical protein CROQUDRAFT_104939 [Cronartium quercuum f. sp. fusiforme G11]|uniref:Uncharacterized protein n=1 Tax=Cronartium quercuum f. sp. fusiforme G11 TaxID=708437 RepID=A0A9P6NST2_9BASI|nr:hypothetical protein CROQUDRAFT_104939 [Cronartium quercuum f. sp. fusiforme G11]
MEDQVVDTELTVEPLRRYEEDTEMRSIVSTNDKTNKSTDEVNKNNAFEDALRQLNEHQNQPNINKEEKIQTIPLEKIRQFYRISNKWRSPNRPSEEPKETYSVEVMDMLNEHSKTYADWEMWKTQKNQHGFKKETMKAKKTHQALRKLIGKALNREMNGWNPYEWDWDTLTKKTPSVRNKAGTSAKSKSNN